VDVNYNSRTLFTYEQWNLHGEEEEGSRESRGKQTWRRLTVLLMVVAVAHAGDQVVCSQWVAIPDGGSALSLFCVFLCVSSSPRFCLLLLCFFFLFR
jgi:hypothetical protein